MASGETALYDLPYPLSSDPVNVHGDIQSLAEQLDSILSSLGLPYHTLEIRNESGSSITKGDPVYISGYSSGESRPLISKTIGTNLATFPVIGLAKETVSNNTNGVILLSGVFSGINLTSYTAGDKLYVASSGGLTNTQPASGSGVVAVVAHAGATGILIVGPVKGNGTWGSLKAGLA